MYHSQSRTAGTAATRSHFQPALTFDYDAQLAGLARRLLASAIGITPADRQFLKDLSRSETRYPMRTLRRLNRIAAASVNPEDREGPAELVRADIFAQTGRIGCLFTAFDAENAANDWFDRTQWQLERAIRSNSLTSAVLDEFELAGVRQLSMTRESIDQARSLYRSMA